MVEQGIDPVDERLAREPGVRRFVRALRERWLIVAITVVAAIAVAGLYVSLASKTYQAEADLLISPESDPNLSALSLFRSSGDPTRDTETASLLIDTLDVARRAAVMLQSSESPQALLGRVQVNPVAGSDVIAVTAMAPAPVEAARLANAFAQAAIDTLSRRLQAELQTLIPRLEAQVTQSSPSGSATASQSLSAQLSALRALQGAPDPTIALESRASIPLGPASPKRKLSLLAGAILGLVVGIAIAIAADVLDPRLRRESQLRGVLALPVLARVPWLPEGGQGRSRAGPEERRSLLTAHEFLAEALGVFDEALDRKRTVVFSAAHRGAGCTTTAVHHAWLVAATGQRVILIDGDPSEPAVGSATGAQPSPALEHVLVGDRPIDEALVPVEAGGVGLRVLALQREAANGFSARMPRGREMIAELLSGTDVLVVDAPPLTGSARALLLARSVDSVVVVARIGVTRLAELRELGETLASHGVRSAGVVLLGGSSRANGRRRGKARSWREALVQASQSTLSRSGSREDSRRARGRPDVGRPHALAPGDADAHRRGASRDQRQR